MSFQFMGVVFGFTFKVELKVQDAGLVTGNGISAGNSINIMHLFYILLVDCMSMACHRKNY